MRVSGAAVAVAVAVAVQLPAVAVQLPVRIASWNVFWASLDDDLGRAAVVETIDNAASSSAFDFFVAVEASGDSPDGRYGVWDKQSNALSAMTGLSTTSRHETLALFYNPSSWTLDYNIRFDYDVQYQA